MMSATRNLFLEEEDGQETTNETTNHHVAAGHQETDDAGGDNNNNNNGDDVSSFASSSVFSANEREKFAAIMRNLFSTSSSVLSVMTEEEEDAMEDEINFADHWNSGGDAVRILESKLRQRMTERFQQGKRSGIITNGDDDDDDNNGVISERDFQSIIRDNDENDNNDGVISERDFETPIRSSSVRGNNDDGVISERDFVEPTPGIETRSRSGADVGTTIGNNNADGDSDDDDTASSTAPLDAADIHRNAILDIARKYTLDLGHILQNHLRIVDRVTPPQEAAAAVAETPVVEQEQKEEQEEADKDKDKDHDVNPVVFDETATFTAQWTSLNAPFTSDVDAHLVSLRAIAEANFQKKLTLLVQQHPQYAEEVAPGLAWFREYLASPRFVEIVDGTMIHNRSEVQRHLRTLDTDLRKSIAAYLERRTRPASTKEAVIAIGTEPLDQFMRNMQAVAEAIVPEIITQHNMKMVEMFYPIWSESVLNDMHQNVAPRNGLVSSVVNMLFPSEEDVDDMEFGNSRKRRRVQLAQEEDYPQHGNTTAEPTVTEDEHRSDLRVVAVGRKDCPPIVVEEQRVHSAQPMLNAVNSVSSQLAIMAGKPTHVLHDTTRVLYVPRSSSKDGKSTDE